MRLIETPAEQMALAVFVLCFAFVLRLVANGILRSNLVELVGVATGVSIVMVAAAVLRVVT